MAVALHDRVATVIFVGLLAAVGFATIAPLQMWTLGKAKDAGQSPWIQLQHRPFNLGNALGAWAGRAVIDHGPRFGFVPLVATAFGMVVVDYPSAGTV